MKKFLLILLALIMSINLIGCEVEPSETRKETDYQKELAEQASDMVGNPFITNFTLKKQLKMIYEKTDDSKLVCYVYSQNLNGEYLYVGQSLGYGIPYSTQYTNPETPYWGDYLGTYRDYAIPQADPDGLYRPDGLSATWLIMIDEKTGENYVMYCEPTIVVTEHKLPKRLIVPSSIEGIKY